MIKDENIVRSRNEGDCMVCCLAMVLGWSYEQAAKYFPPIAIEGRGFYWDPVFDLLRPDAVVFDKYWLADKNWDKVDMRRISILDVPSLNNPENQHAIVWDGERLIDPLEEGKVYKRFPKLLTSWVYQPVGREYDPDAPEI